MQSGDGLIVRVRPQSASLRPQDVSALADAARQFGNGHIDLTRRANLQIRGVSEASLPELHDVIAGLGLLDASAEGEAVRNIMIKSARGARSHRSLRCQADSRRAGALADLGQIAMGAAV